MKHIRVFAALAVGLLAFLGWSALQLQKAAASNDPSGTFLVTFTNETTGMFSSKAVFTLHADHSVADVDSGQEGRGTPFSSQSGVWKREPGGVIEARTINWDFPFATEGCARVDYTFFAGQPANQVQGRAVLTFFTTCTDPLGGGGTSGGTFSFTGTRVTVP